ncbi:MAG: hypothetical protein JWM33_2721 [Caulobacteraceae bacterium]|nr:hypothetical protein [Caulobacteraceae bacterium]
MKRWRTPVGSLGVLAFLIAYVWAAMILGQRLPDSRALRLIYYVGAGLLWIFPLMPVLKWMARDDGPGTGQ